MTHPRLTASLLLTGTTVSLLLPPLNLTPLLILALGLSCIGVWAFADEMGAQKPLNRAGLIAFAFSALAKIMALLGQGTEQARFEILYAFTLLLALLLWSAALLHREDIAKRAGAAGLLGVGLPALALLLGHVFVGIGATFGLNALYDLSQSGAATAPILTTINLIFWLWSLIAAFLIWTRRISAA